MTTLDVSTNDKAVAVEHWHRHRTSIKNVRDSKHGAALPHIPSGYAEVNTAWMWARYSPPAWPPGSHQLTSTTRGEDIPEGHGIRGGKAMIATLRHRLINIPGRLIRHAGQLTLRPPPGRDLLAKILARLRALPTLS